MRLDAGVLDVLESAITDGNALRITRQLDRTTYTQVNRALEAAGGKWNRREQAHLFPGDAALIVARLRAEQSVVPERTVQQFFPTPGPVVDQLIEIADVAPSHLVLEPSAGEGAIASRVAPLVAAVDCVELHEQHARVIREARYARRLAVRDFLVIEPKPAYDRVIMNPPFARKAELDHVEHALRFLKPDGLLVSIMSAGITFRTDRRTADFREMVDAAGGGFEPLPDGAFRESGTEAGTVLVAIPKPAARSVADEPEQLDLFGEAVA
jgi:predicted RNA methylase